MAQGDGRMGLQDAQGGVRGITGLLKITRGQCADLLPFPAWGTQYQAEAHSWVASPVCEMVLFIEHLLCARY